MKTICLKTELEVLMSVIKGEAEIRDKILSQVKEEHFGFPIYGDIFKRIKVLTNKGRALPPHALLCEDMGLSDEAKVILKGDKHSVIKGTQITATISQLDEYRKLREIQSTLKSVGEKLQGKDAKDVDAIVSEALANLSKVNADSGFAHSTNEDHQSMVRKVLKGGGSFVETGIEYFDSRNGGFPNKQVVVLAGSTGGGKSAFINWLAINQYYKGYSPLICSMEMDSEEIWRRIISTVSGVAHDQLFRGNVNAAAKEMIKKKMADFNERGKKNNCSFNVFCPHENLKLSELIPKIQIYKPSIVYIDYISLLKPENYRLPTHEQLGEVTRLAKIAATKMKIPIVLLAQINKDDDIKYSGAIQENSGLTIQWSHDSSKSEPGKLDQIEMKITKARNQDKFHFTLNVDFRAMTFSDPTATLMYKKPSSVASKNKLLSNEDEY